MLNKKIIVLSGANITSGGPLTIFNDALTSLSLNKDCEIFAIVGNSKLFYKSDNIVFIELPNYKRLIFLKFFYEYFYYRIISRKIKPDIWISLNDFTPSVKAGNIFTYFHNASIFFRIEASDFKFSRRVIFQKYYYSLFLKFNIKKNKKFIVQQQWIAHKIHEKYNLPIQQLLLFKPNVIIENPFSTSNKLLAENNNSKFILFYPTRAYGYKNVEMICEAMRELYVSGYSQDIELRLTLWEDENAYTRYLKKKYNELDIVWIGPLSKSEVEDNYKEASALVFPSRLETWGLPLTEFSKYRKPIFAIDLEYVHETMQGYPYLSLFKSNDVHKLAELLTKAIDQQVIPYCSLSKIDNNSIHRITTWEELLII